MEKEQTECGDIKFNDQEGKITNSQIFPVVEDGSMKKNQFSSDQTEQQSSCRTASGKLHCCGRAAWGYLKMCGTFAPNLNKIFTQDFAGGRQFTVLQECR